ncbi:MAG: hypothetical protein OXN96_20495 [Bryobacterales bacterium]|nr:hypothetical protein [Bryobacterales bacterium]
MLKQLRRSRDWKYVRYFRSKAQYGEYDVDCRERWPDSEQFLDLKNDPAEETDLVAEPRLQGRIREFRERCEQHYAALVLAR